MRYYTGVGPRKISVEINYLLQRIGGELVGEDYVLRSGHSDGSDKAFELGCDAYGGKKEIYIPWEGFNGSDSVLYSISDEAYELASKYHPNWNNLKDTVKKLHARNCSQVLGKYLDLKSDFLICWTEGGKEIGGTDQALRLAKAYGVPIFNIGKFSNLGNAELALKQFLQKHMIKENTEMKRLNSMNREELKEYMYEKFSKDYIESGYYLSGSKSAKDIVFELKGFSETGINLLLKELKEDGKLNSVESTGREKFFLNGKVRCNLIEENNLINRWKERTWNSDNQDRYSYELELENAKNGRRSY